jgi:4-amino-4-deoxy-L-arabinose transferase-like glycosyltransferase
LVIFAVAFAVRLAHVWPLRDSPFFSILMGDSRGYDEWAGRLAAGDWIGTEVFYQAPLYPYFLGVIYAVFDRDLLIVRIVQALLGSTACVLLGLAAARLFSNRAGLLAGLGLGLYAPAIFLDGLIQKSTLDVFFVCLALWCISELVVDPRRRPIWLALGMVLGGLSLTRENAAVLVGIVLVWAVASEWRTSHNTSTLSRLSGALLVLLGLAFVLTPVARTQQPGRRRLLSDDVAIRVELLHRKQPES